MGAEQKAQHFKRSASDTIFADGKSERGVAPSTALRSFLVDIAHTRDDQYDYWYAQIPTFSSNQNIITT